MREENVCVAHVRQRKKKKKQENNAEKEEKNRKVSLSDLRNAPTFFAPLFGEVGEISTAHSNTSRTKRENKGTSLCAHSKTIAKCRQVGN